MPNPSPDITGLLTEAHQGNVDAMADLLPLLYDELRNLARSQRRKQGAPETLNTTALVHEAYERLAHADIDWESRRHFFGVAAKAMRGIIVDAARERSAVKRGGDWIRIPFQDVELATEVRAQEVLELDEALHRLNNVDERQKDIVELRYFIGLTISETAELLDLSVSTVKREWTMARAWLHRDLSSTILD